MRKKKEEKEKKEEEGGEEEEVEKEEEEEEKEGSKPAEQIYVDTEIDMLRWKRHNLTHKKYF